jgi:hypothetical protein
MGGTYNEHDSYHSEQKKTITDYLNHTALHISFRTIKLKHGSQNGLLSRKKNEGSSNGFSQP